MKLKRGDVVYVELPATKMPGHEQLGLRPAVVLQSDPYASPATTVVVIPATSKVAASRFAYSVRVDPDGSNGLTFATVFLVSQVRAIDQGRVQSVIGELSLDHMRLISDELAKLLGLA